MDGNPGGVFHHRLRNKVAMTLRFALNHYERPIHWRQRLLTRIILWVLLTFIVVFGSTAYLLIQHEQKSTLQQQINISRQLGNVLTDTLSTEMIKSNTDKKDKSEVWKRVEQLTDKMKNASGALRIQILSQQGEVLVGTDFALANHTYNVTGQTSPFFTK